MGVPHLTSLYHSKALFVRKLRVSTSMCERERRTLSGEDEEACLVQPLCAGFGTHLWWEYVRVKPLVGGFSRELLETQWTVVHSSGSLSVVLPVWLGQKGVCDLFLGKCELWEQRWSRFCVLNYMIRSHGGEQRWRFVCPTECNLAFPKVLFVVGSLMLQ